MQRIDDPSNIPAPQTPLSTVSPGFFRRPSVLAGDQGTILTGDWANDIQEAVCHPIEASGIVLTKGDFGQLTAAIEAIRDAALNPHAATISTTSSAAHLEVANASEMLALSAAGRAVTPFFLGDAFDVEVTNPGGMRIPLPGGGAVLLINWGYLSLPSSTPSTFVNLAKPYSTANLLAIATGLQANPSTSDPFLYAARASLTQIEIVTQSNLVATEVNWLSIGY